MILKFIYDYYASKISAQNKDIKGFADFEILFVWLSILNLIDNLIFILLPVSFMKQLLTWVPEYFKATTDLLLTYLNRK